jgi:tryptophan 6-halogenase
VHEFLVLHYLGAARRDTPYWQATKERAVPDGLRERLELWSVGLPGVETIYPHYHGFEPYNWAVMLLGLGGVPVKPRPALELLDSSAARCEFETVRRESLRLARELPSHYGFLSQMH